MKVNYILEEVFNIETKDEDKIKELFILKYYNYIKKRENINS